MDKLSRLATFGAFLCCVGFGIGCGEKSPPPPSFVAGEDSQDAAEKKLPGAGAVMAALDEGDYAKAISSLAKLGRQARPEQKIDVMVLTREVNMKLLEASATDPKAKEALEAMRIMSIGR